MKQKRFYEIWGFLSLSIPTRTAEWHMAAREHEVCEAIQKIKHLAIKHNRCCICLCNGTTIMNANRVHVPDAILEKYRYDQEQFDKDIEKIENKIDTLAKEFSIWAEYQYDPCGATVKLFAHPDLEGKGYERNLTDILYI